MKLDTGSFLERRTGVRFTHTCPHCGQVRRCTTGECPEPAGSPCPGCAPPLDLDALNAWMEAH